ncbi:alpha/beta fold hydrolase [Nonomuraea sp. KM90]|uniref:alpha/beta fold hydrolase n=1 Tax=Nonomuraea sp. KM90 TaxID=3457428 RepID=UPI003FCCCABE
MGPAASPVGSAAGLGVSGAGGDQEGELGPRASGRVRVRFSAEWQRPWRNGTLPAARPDRAAERLARLGVPILLLHGRQDMTFPASLAEEAAELIPSARAEVLDEAGHMAHVDQPVRWLEAVSGFLDRGTARYFRKRGGRGQAPR